jgi:hypothetical protein
MQKHLLFATPIIQVLCARPSLSTLLCLATSFLPPAGRLPIKVSGTGACPSTGVLSAPPLTSWQQHMAPGRWQAKHVRLCNSIEVTIPPEILEAAAPQPPMPGSDDCSQMDCSLLEASIAAGLTIAAQGPSLVPPVAPPVAGCWQPAQQQQEEPTQDVYYIDTETAAATLPASATAASSSMGMQTADHAISFASSLLSRGFSQLRLEGPHTSTFAAVAAAVQASPHTAAAALAGVSTDNDLGGSSGQQRQQRPAAAAAASSGSSCCCSSSRKRKVKGRQDACNYRLCPSAATCQVTAGCCAHWQARRSSLLCSCA